MKFLQNLFKNYLIRISWITIMIVVTTIILGATNYNPVGSNSALPQPNYHPIGQSYSNYTITAPTFDTIVNNSNYIIINITNNVTTFVTNNLTNNITNTIENNITTYINFTNNITNDVTTYVNVTNNITNNFSNNFYSGWITIENNVTNNITQYINTTQLVEVTYNLTNNITNIINNTNYINNLINITLTNNITDNSTINFNVFNITNNNTFNYSYYFNVPYSLSPYILTFENSSNISFNESYLFSSLYNNNFYNGTLTTNYLIKFNGTNFIDSPIKSYTSDENVLIIYDNLLRLDNTHHNIGINVQEGFENHEQALSVQTFLLNITGSIVSTGQYNSVTNSTNFTSTISLGEDFIDGGSIYDNLGNYQYYIFEKYNDSSFSVRGNISNGTILTNWKYKQAPYIDISGGSEEERGISFSNNNDWKWAMFIEDNTNNDKFCIQSSEKYFTDKEFNCQLEIDTVGNVNIGGSINSKGFYGELFNTTSTTRTLTTRYVWYNLTKFEIGEINGWYSSGTGDLICNKSGLYEVSYLISATLNANDEVDFILVNNGIAINKSLVKTRYVSGQYEASSINLLYRFEVGDILQLQASDQTSNGKTLTEDNRNIIVNRISK